MMFQYDDFRDLTSGAPVGTEPLLRLRRERIPRVLLGLVLKSRAAGGSRCPDYAPALDQIEDRPLPAARARRVSLQVHHRSLPDKHGVYNILVVICERLPA